jgi:flavin-dependent dehydrogenase
MAKAAPQLDVLVLGEHPAAYLAAALLKHKTKFRVTHSTIPGEDWPDRLVMINPDFYDLHPLLEPLRKKLDTRGVYGLQFLGNDPATRGEYRSKSIVADVGSLENVRAAMEAVAKGQDVDLATPKQLVVHRLDERGIEITLGNQQVYPKAVVLAGRLEEAYHRVLGVPEEWETGVLHRYSFVKLKGTKWVDLGTRPLIPMSLDLDCSLYWGWLLPGPKHVQLAVEQPLESTERLRPLELLRHWVKVLSDHQVLKAPVELTAAMVTSMDLPFAGALAQEGLANRTLLVGPAGGFVSANAEDVYPTCWSAIHAADVLKKALKEQHLQDALQPYRQKWRTTLGDYLRGPQQNLKFLLPLVYRNQNMTDRLAEAILTGQSVVR